MGLILVTDPLVIYSVRIFVCHFSSIMATYWVGIQVYFFSQTDRLEWLFKLRQVWKILYVQSLNKVTVNTVVYGNLMVES